MNSTPASDTDQDVTGAETAPQEPGHHVEERELPDFPLAVYSGHRPEQVLAAWGLTSLLPGALVRFDGPWATPIISWEGTKEQLALTAAEGVICIRQELDAAEQVFGCNVNVERSSFNDLAQNEWNRLSEFTDIASTHDRTLTNQFVPAHTKQNKGKTTTQALRSTLTLRHHKTGYVAYLDAVLGMIGGDGTPQDKGSPNARSGALPLSRAFQELLNGSTRCMSNKYGLGYSAYELSPRSKSGGSETTIVPITDILALAGQLLLQPLQKSLAGEPHTFSWMVNPIPLTVSQVIDLHESPQHLDWPRHEIAIKKAPSGSDTRMYFDRDQQVTVEGGRHA